MNVISGKLSIFVQHILQTGLLTALYILVICDKSFRHFSLYSSAIKKNKCAINVCVSNRKIYLSQIVKCICLQFQNIFVFSCKMYLSYLDIIMAL